METKTAEEIAKEILFMPVTNGHHVASIIRGTQLIEEYRNQPRPNEASAEPPIWYDELSINNHLQNLHIPEQYRKVLVKDLADCLQQAFKKGWEKGFNDIQKNGTWEYVYYQPENAQKQSSNVGDGWISVKDRLPEKEGTVLACTNYEKIVTAYFMIISKEWDVTGFDGAKAIDFITHWQPLPSPPKQ